MMKRLLIKISVILLLFTGYSNTLDAADKDVVIKNLKVEYTETPLGLDVELPRFSWQMQTDQPGAYQKAYQLIVTDENLQKVWDSGKVNDGHSLTISYEGTPLKPTTRYHWQLTVWDQQNKQHTSSSWFETGLMNPDPSSPAWSGARWIGGGDEDMPFYSHYLPVFRINYVLQLDKSSNSNRAGFIYGANDARLMDKNKNLYHLENKENESYIMIELDITPLHSGDSAVLNVFRVGYHPNDKKDVPFKSYPIPPELINNQNKYETHRFSILTNFGETRIFLKDKENEIQLASLNLNPLGQGGDFIAFPVAGDIGYKVPQQQKATFALTEIGNFRAPGNILFSQTTRTISGNPDKEVTSFYNPSRNSMPMLRTVFSTAGQPVAKARLYVTARGIYELYLNGNRVGDDYFNPGLTQYNKTQLYQTYDVTDYIQSGANAIGALLAEGWWSGNATYTGDNWNFFGDRQSLLAKLVITYSDGKEEIMVSNPANWSYFNNGPIVYSSFFQGEVYDASKESLIKGWSTPAYDASAWKPAREITLKDNVHPTVFNNSSEMVCIGQFGQTVKKINELTAISMEEVRPGVFVYDMGQNMVGVPRISLSGMQPGTPIILRFAEVKYPDLPEYKGHTGMVMLENIRAAMAQDIYITKGGNETIQPRFTFHGYRFIEITGIEKPLPPESVKGIVLSSIDGLASSYETSDEKVNKLWKNITWSTYGNFLSIPTDCPQRNERMGWSGDISVFGRAATYLAELPQFLRRHMLAMRNTQHEDGRFVDVAPLDVGFGGMLWGSAGITVAWESYLQYRDKQLLTEHYDAMKRYIHYLLEKTIEPETNVLVQNRAWGDLGDWLGPEDGKNDKSLLWECYLIYDLELMQKMASILNKKEDAGWFNKLYNERKAFFNRTYIQPETGKTVFSAFDSKKTGNLVDTQTSYVLPLVFNIIDPDRKEKVIANLLHTLERENKADNGVSCPPYSLMTGFIGTSWISKALSDCGHGDAAYRLLLQNQYPSWLYSVEQGATTIWERLNSYTHTDGFGGNNRMNSFNHYSFGAVAAWMYNYSLGIERDENVPGFKHFILQPQPDPTGQLTFAKGHYDSMYGRIESSWEIKGNKIHYQFTIPTNTSATLYLNSNSEKSNAMTTGGKALKSIKGVKDAGRKNGKEVYVLPAGKYEIVTDKEN